MHFPRFHSPCPSVRFLRVRLFLLVGLRDVKPQPIGIQIELVFPTRLLQNRCNVPRVLDPSQVDITPTLLDGVANELRRASFTLRSYNRSLLFLASFVYNEGSPLGFLLGNLFGFDCCGEFGRERQVLE